MKKIVFITLLFLFVTTHTMAQDIKSDELTDIASFVTGKNLKVDNWKVTLKEKIVREDIQAIIKALKRNHTVQKTEDENIVKYMFKDTHKSENIVVSYNVIIPKVGSYSAELIAVIEGASWSDSIEESYQLKRNLIVNRFFTKSKKTFACLTTHQGAIIGSDYFLKEFTNYLNLQHEVTQVDTVGKSAHKKIIYGYTELWEDKISISGSPVNFQVAVTTDENNKPKYTIGTPILINEY